MKEISAHTLRSLQLEMLKYIDEICTNNNLRYYAAYGTLLGAIRHQGFIPWDDDIDLYMPRSDFDKFQRIVKADNTYYNVISMLNTSSYYQPFAKLSDFRTVLIENNEPKEYDQGVYIDIFILDSLPSDKKKAKRAKKKCHRYMILTYSLADNGFPKDKRGIVLLKSIFVWAYIKVILLLGKQDSIKMKYEKAAKKYDYNNSIICFPECPFYTELYSKSTFEKYKTATFEDMTVRVPNNYKECLVQCYGDYMTLPPEEQRVATHQSVAYWKD